MHDEVMSDSGKSNATSQATACDGEDSAPKKQRVDEGEEELKIDRLTNLPKEILCLVLSVYSNEWLEYRLIMQFVKCSGCKNNLRMVNKKLCAEIGEPDTLLSLIMSIREHHDGSLVGVSLDWQHLSKHVCAATLFDALSDSERELFNVDLMCGNRHIAFEFYRRFKDYFDWPKCWSTISSNPCVTEDIIRENVNLPWDWAAFAENANLSVEFYRDFQSKPIAWGNIEHLETSEFLELCDKPLDWSAVWDRAQIEDMEEGGADNRLLVLAQRPMVISKIGCFHGSLAPLNLYQMVKLAPIEKGISLWSKFSHCDDVTIDHILANPTVAWDWDALDDRFTLSDKLKGPGLPWKTFDICSNDEMPSFTYIANHIRQYGSSGKWKIVFYSNFSIPELLNIHNRFSTMVDWDRKSSVVGIDKVLEHPNAPWKWSVLSRTLGRKSAENHPELSWDFGLLSNYSFPFSFVKDHIGKWRAKVWQNVELSGPIPDIRIQLLSVKRHINMGMLTRNKTLTAELILATRGDLSWPFEQLGRFDKIPLPSPMPADFSWSTYSKCVSEKTFLEHLDYPWNVHNLVANENISLDIILSAAGSLKMNTIDKNALTNHAVDRRDCDLQTIRENLTSNGISKNCRIGAVLSLARATNIDQEGSFTKCNEQQLNTRMLGGCCKPSKLSILSR